MNFPILSSLILLPLVGSLFILFIKDNASKNYQNIKYVSLFVSFANFLISIYLWYQFDNSTSEFQFIESKQWLKGFVNYKVGIDGISILFILLTTLITPLCIISINNSINFRLKEFLIAILVFSSYKRETNYTIMSWVFILGCKNIFGDYFFKPAYLSTF